MANLGILQVRPLRKPLSLPLCNSLYSALYPIFKASHASPTVKTSGKSSNITNTAPYEFLFTVMLAREALNRTVNG